MKQGLFILSGLTIASVWAAPSHARDWTAFLLDHAQTQKMSFAPNETDQEDTSIFLQYRLDENNKMSPYLGIGVNYDRDYVELDAQDTRDPGFDSTLSAAVKFGLAYKFYSPLNN